MSKPMPAGTVVMVPDLHDHMRHNNVATVYMTQEDMMAAIRAYLRQRCRLSQRCSIHVPTHAVPHFINVRVEKE